MRIKSPSGCETKMSNARESLQNWGEENSKVEISEFRILIDHKLVCNEHAAKLKYC